MEKIKELMKKVLTKEVILYIVFGVATTVINIVTSYILKAVFKVEGNIASTIGIIVCVLFAYFTNRKLVFNSQANTIKEQLKEFVKFVLGRAVTMIVEIVGVFLLNNVIHAFYGMFSDNLAYLINKLIISVVVVILNFFISKFFTFRNNK